MKKTITIKELVDLSYNKYKSKNAITLQGEGEYEKNINYFNFNFDIYSLARALKSKKDTIKNQRVAILSENRYEFLITYLANIIVKNTVIIIDVNLNKQAIEKIIKKQQINTIFFSNKNRDKVIEIYKLNENNKSNKRKIINLINFDPIKKFPIIEYEKLINIGRYIENYSIDNKLEQETTTSTKNTIIVNADGVKEYYEQDLIESAYIISREIKLKKKKKMQSLYQINGVYKIIIEILMPMLYGINIQYGLFDYQNKKIENIQIPKEGKKETTIIYRNNYYKIENIGQETNVVKQEKPKKIWQKNRRLESSNFILIKSGEEKNKSGEKVTI